MGEGISGGTKREVVEVLRQRYRSATRAEKVLVLDELVRLAKCHRKHANRLLLGEGLGTASPTRHS